MHIYMIFVKLEVMILEVIILEKCNFSDLKRVFSQWEKRTEELMRIGGRVCLK